MSKKNEELFAVARKAATAAELAAANIHRYNELHTGTAKPLVMKVADAADSELKAVIDASAKAAINNLKRYLDLKGE